MAYRKSASLASGEVGTWPTFADEHDSQAEICIDHVQVGMQQLSQWSAPPEEYMRLERLQARVKNQENRTATRELVVQFVWWDWE